MTKQEKREIEKIKQAINGLANMYGDLAFELKRANKSKLPNGAMVLLVGKDNHALDEKTIEYFVKHNRKVREETAREIYNKIKVELLCADMETDRPATDYRFRMIDLIKIAGKAVVDVTGFNFMEVNE